MPDLICDNCNKAIAGTVHPYTMKIELFARVEESLKIAEGNEAIDFDAEIRKIIAQLESMSSIEREEEESRIYTSFQYVLCTPCRDSLARRLKRSVKSL